MPDPRRNVGYIRESSADEERDLDSQKRGQIEDIHTLARRDGLDPEGVHIYDDWGHSGSEHARRPAQQELLREVKAGRIATIYARSLDRLMRSTQRLAELWRLCGETGTRIVTLREGDVSPEHIEQNPSAWMFVQSVMTAAEYESRVGRVRAQAGIATKRRDGTPIGRKPYGSDPDRPTEDVGVIMDAYAEGGSFLAASRILNNRGVPTRTGGRWDTKTVGRIVRRVSHVRDGHRGDFADQMGNVVCPRCVSKRRGASVAAKRMFAGLLRCHCGETLTSMPRRGSIGYYCRSGHLAGVSMHGPYVVSEHKVRAWAQEQLDGWVNFVQERHNAPDAATMRERLADLDARRARILDMYEAGDIDRSERERRLARNTAERQRVESALDVTTTFVFQKEAIIDWTAKPAEINDRLRKVWQAVVMKRNGGMTPLRAVWVPIPGEYGEDGPSA